LRQGQIRANRVKLNSTAMVDGDIYHRSLAIEENAQFEGRSRRQENVIDTPSLVPAKLSAAQAINGNGQAKAQRMARTQGRRRTCRKVATGRSMERTCPFALHMSAFDPKRTCVHGLTSDAGATELNLTTSSALFPQA
jgi:hypothetical protein